MKKLIVVNVSQEVIRSKLISKSVSNFKALKVEKFAYADCIDNLYKREQPQSNSNGLAQRRSNRVIVALVVLYSQGMLFEEGIKALLDCVAVNEVNKFEGDLKGFQRNNDREQYYRNNFKPEYWLRPYPSGGNPLSKYWRQFQGNKVLYDIFGGDIIQEENIGIKFRALLLKLEHDLGLYHYFLKPSYDNDMQVKRLRKESSLLLNKN